MGEKKNPICLNNVKIFILNYYIYDLIEITTQCHNKVNFTVYETFPFVSVTEIISQM